MKTYLRILTYARPIGKYAGSYAIYALLAIFFGLVNYSFLMPTLDILFEQNVTGSTTQVMGGSYRLIMENYTKTLITEYGKTGALLAICIILVSSNFVTNIFRYLSIRISNKVRADVVRSLRADIFRKITNLHIGYFSNEKK